ncbi:MAG: type II secretion system F family protein [Chloroflexota bacterium]
MDTVLLSSILTGVAVFSLLMFIFDLWLFPPQPKLDAVRASVLPRERYERLVTADRPWWERLLAPVAARLGKAMPALASQVSERDIVRAGFDPATLTPAEVYAAKLVLGVAILGIGLALTPLFEFALIVALPIAFIGYIFPTEYLGSLGRRRKAQLMRELPDFLALVRPLSESPGLEKAMARVADELHAASEGENLLAHQVRSAIAAYGTGVNFFAALADVAAAADLEELDELAGALGQARRTGKGVPDVLAEHERSLREAERNRLLGAASTVQPKLAGILAVIYLPMFLVLIVVPLFLSTLGRI